MNHRILTTTLCALAGTMLAGAQVPGLINYQGRLTDATGAPVTGSKNFSLSIYDAATGGNLLYTESIGAVTLDANGVYSFQFGSAGTSNSQVTETIATTDASTLVYSKALANAGVVENSLSVTDGTNSWTQSAGNPGVGAAATANTISGFVIGATITNGGSGYTSPPEVTITGLGSGAAATATLTGGVVTGITITSAGSGYTGGATISIAPPVIPFRVEYSGGSITATYSSVPAAGTAITATYRYGTSGISGALGGAAEQWIEVSVDGTPQGTRQRVLTVPFAINSSFSNHAAVADMVLDKSLFPQSNGSDYALMASEQIKAGITGKIIDQNKMVEYFTTPQGHYSTVDTSNTTSSFGLNGDIFYRSYITETAEEGTSVSWPYEVEVTKTPNARLRFIYFYGSKPYSNACNANCSAEITYSDGSIETISDQIFFPFGSGSGPEYQPQIKHIRPSKPESVISSIKIKSYGSAAMSRKIILVWNAPSSIKLFPRPGFFEASHNYRLITDTDTQLTGPEIELTINHKSGSIAIPNNGHWIALPPNFEDDSAYPTIHLKNSNSTSSTNDHVILRGIIILKSAQ